MSLSSGPVFQWPALASTLVTLQTGETPSLTQEVEDRLRGMGIYR